MGKRIAAVDDYIAKAQPFARPILERLRDGVHAASPEIEETMRWGMPFFDYQGMLAYMAGFKKHASFSFQGEQALAARAENIPGLGHGVEGFGRLLSLDDVPSKRIIVSLVKLAMTLRREAKDKPEAPAKRVSRPLPKMPAPFASALAESPAARATWEALPPGQRREYLDWVAEAKTTPTRDRRIATSVDWLAEGKTRNWKYVAKR